MKFASSFAYDRSNARRKRLSTVLRRGQNLDRRDRVVVCPGSRYAADPPDRRATTSAIHGSIAGLEASLPQQIGKTRQASRRSIRQSLLRSFENPTCRWASSFFSQSTKCQIPQGGNEFKLLRIHQRDWSCGFSGVGGSFHGGIQLIAGHKPRVMPRITSRPFGKPPESQRRSKRICFFYSAINSAWHWPHTRFCPDPWCPVLLHPPRADRR
jgi:hypothetical protein